MDIEKRLEYMLNKRVLLQKAIEDLQNGKISEYGLSDSYVDQFKDKKSAKLEYAASEMTTLFSTEKKDLGFNTEEGFFITSDFTEEKYVYLYSKSYFKLTQVCPYGALKILISGTAEGDVRPVVTFFDSKNSKLDHYFIRLNVPIKLEIPQNATSVNIGFRFTGKTAFDLTGIKFNVNTLSDTADVNYLSRICNKLDCIPESNGCRYYNTYGKFNSGKFGIIADRFLYDSYKDVGSCVYITPDNYQNEKIDFLIVASAWHGLNNEWDDMAKPETSNGQKIYEVIDFFKKNNVPVVFYSKEDPPNYAIFVDIAKKCDVIFTSASEMIDSYKKDCKTDNVAALCFSINPCFNNPIGINASEPEDGVIFSGSWMEKYSGRTEKLVSIFDGIIASGKNLKIIDRNYDKNDPKYFFPEKYYQYISPAVDHEKLQKIHKLFKWAVNINSVTDSKTMFANRVYELQALGNILFSNYSIGMAEKFDGVFIVESPEDVSSVLSGMTDEEIYALRMKNLRRIMTGETTFDRLKQITDSIGVDYDFGNRKVAVIVNEITEELKNEFNDQSYGNKILLSSDGITPQELEDADIIAFWSNDYEYGKYYLEDLINGFKYTNCDFITKDAYMDNGTLREGTEHNYVSDCDKFRTVFWKNSFELTALIADTNGFGSSNGYSIDHFELIKK